MKVLSAPKSLTFGLQESITMPKERDRRKPFRHMN
jgi:hypothetical protein